MAMPPAKDGGEGVDWGGNTALLGVVAGVEFADELCEEDGHTRPTRLLLLSRQVSGFGRRRSEGEDAAEVLVGVRVEAGA